MAGKHRASDDDQVDADLTGTRPDPKHSATEKGSVYKSRNAQKPAGSDLPARGKGITIEDA
jgi:hypothetical protein